MYFRNRSNIYINVSLLLPLLLPASVGWGIGLENFPRCWAEFVLVGNEQEKWDRTKHMWKEQLQSKGKNLRTIQGIDLTPSESATDLSRGQQHEEGWCDLAPQYYFKFSLSPANLSLINIVKRGGGNKGIYVKFRCCSWSFHTTSVLLKYYFLSPHLRWLFHLEPRSKRRPFSISEIRNWFNLKRWLSLNSTDRNLHIKLSLWDESTVKWEKCD